MDDTTPTLADQFLDLHVQGTPLVMANAWDVGSAKLLASLGFRAIATTSSGHAATFGELDGAVGRDDALAHAADLVAAVDVPVSADLEDGYGDTPAQVADTVTAAAATGLAGCSIEDWSGAGESIHDLGPAVERVAAAVEAARGPERIILTARAENHIRGRDDLDDTIARLQAFQEAGADVLYAPGLARLDDIRRVVGAVDRPVNVLILPGGPTVGELAEVGVARVSVGGAFAFAALEAVARAGRELLDEGTNRFWEAASEGGRLARAAFGR